MSHQRCSVKKGVAKLSQISQENACVGLGSCNFIKKRLKHRFFLVKLSKLLRTSIATREFLRTTAFVKLQRFVSCAQLHWFVTLNPYHSSIVDLYWFWFHEDFFYVLVTNHFCRNLGWKTTSKNVFVLYYLECENDVHICHRGEHLIRLGQSYFPARFRVNYG